MKITQIAIEIHEKRNHPYEYGNYDASCRLTADIEGTDDPDEVMGTLRMVARAEVQAELDMWIGRIERQKQQAALPGEIRREIRDLRYVEATDRPASVAVIMDMITRVDDADKQEVLLQVLAGELVKLDQETSTDNDVRPKDDWPPESPF